MLKKYKFKIKKFKQGNIKIETPKDYDQLMSIGDWNEYYPELKLIYNNKIEPDYPYTYIIKDGNIIIGYFISMIIIDENKNYQRKMVLNDFGIYSRSYAKYGKLLINYLIELARSCYCTFIEIVKEQGYNSFYQFLERHYNLIDEKDKFCLEIKEPLKVPYQNNLRIFNDDNISIENLYFLYSLKFKIYRNKCIFKKDNNIIEIDRRTGEINLPRNIYTKDKIALNDNTKNVIFMLCDMYHNDLYEDIYIKYDKELKEIKYACYHDTYITFKPTNEVFNDYNFLNKTYVEGYNFIKIYNIDFDYHNLWHNNYFNEINIKELLYKKSKYLDLKGPSLKEKGIELKTAEEFNNKLDEIVSFDFRMGNSFCGIKKFSIVFADEVVEIKHNGSEKIEQVISKNDVLNALKKISFANWNNNYINNDNPITENAWQISLKINNNKYQFEGLNDYPNSWIFIIDLIEKYSSIKLRKEMI